MTLEDRLRQMVTALPNEASIMLPVAVLREWLNDEADDVLTDLTVAQVSTQIGRSPGRVREWIRSGELDAYWLGREYRITRPALTAFRNRRRERPRSSVLAPSRGADAADLGAWRRVREART